MKKTAPDKVYRARHSELLPYIALEAVLLFCTAMIQKCYERFNNYANMMITLHVHMCVAGGVWLEI